jgi:hypothetical protein
MATTTASLTLSSSDLTGDALALTTTTNLSKAGVTTGLDQFTGVARKTFATAVTDENLIASADYTNSRAHKLYIKNTSTNPSEYFTVEIGSTNVVIGRLYAGDFMFIPYDGSNDIDIDASAAGMTVEFAVFYEA